MNKRLFSVEIEAVARALCDYVKINPERETTGVTGARWKAWEQMAIYEAPTFLKSLKHHGCRVVQD